MSMPFIGQIMPTSFNFSPKGFAQCNGQLLPINQNQPLFSLIGTTYGGDGRVTFALPDLRGRTPYGISANNPWGAPGGQENVTLTASQIPSHTHSFGYSSQAGNERNPRTALLGNTGSTFFYAPANGAQVFTNQNTISLQGQNQPHNNMQPFGVLNFVIALVGIFPSQS